MCGAARFFFFAKNDGATVSVNVRNVFYSITSQLSVRTMQFVFFNMD